MASGASEGRKVCDLFRSRRGISTGLALWLEASCTQLSFIQQKLKTLHRAECIPDLVKTHSWTFWVSFSGGSLPGIIKPRILHLATSSWLWKRSLTDSIWVSFRNETVPSLCRAKAGAQHRQCACCRNAFPPGLLRRPLCARVESCLPQKPSCSHKHSSADVF